MQRVAAYCRVSTDKEDQANSLASQKSYFGEYIQRNPLWELTDIYVDEGITGTSTKKRHSFNRMVADAQNRKFDLLLTKEISRFARNTLDSIYYTRKLKEWGVGVLFLRDNINTLDPDAELRLTIMSSIAQEESRKTSDRVKWGQKRRMEQGVVFGRSMLGYDVRDGQLSVNEEGAEVVRLIFHKFVTEGKGTHIIARELREAGIPTYNYIKNWSNTVILRALRNEKYAGDLTQKKTFTPDYLTHEKKYNHGEEELVTLRDHHAPIIDRDLFDRAQAELEQRAPSEEQRSRHSNRYCFSGKLQCGFCGSTFVSRTKRRKDNSQYKAWRCSEAALHGSPQTDANGNPIGCDGRQINHDDLLLIMSQVVSHLSMNREAIAEQLTSVLRVAFASEQENGNAEQLQGRIRQAESKKQQLIELLLNGDINKPDFTAMSARYEQELERLKVQLTACANQEETRKNQDAVITTLSKSIRDMMDGEVRDEVFYRSILDKIVIYDRTRMDVTLNLLPEKFSYLITDLAKPPGEPSGVFSGTDIGTEELAHIEMISAILYQLTRNLSMSDIKKSGFDTYFVDHTTGIYPQAASGTPFSAGSLQVTGDPLADIYEDLAAEQKARLSYDNILRLIDDPDVRDPIKFLREREIVHFQRFGEAKRTRWNRTSRKRIADNKKLRAKFLYFHSQFFYSM